MVGPKEIAGSTNQLINAWNTLAPGSTFGGMTLAQYKTKVQPSFETRTQLDGLNAQLMSTTDKRDNADKVTLQTNQLVVNAVKGDPTFGDDSDLYDAMGYTRRASAPAVSRGANRPRRPSQPSKSFNGSKPEF